MKHAPQIVKTFAFLDTGSSISFINQSLQKLLKVCGTDTTLNVAGIYGAQNIACEVKVHVSVKGSSSAVFQLSFYSHPGIERGNTSYDYNKLIEEFEHLSLLPNKRFNLAEVGIIIGQDFYDLQRPLDYRLGRAD